MRIPVYSDILPGKVKVLREKNRVFSTSTSRNLKDHLSSNLRRGQSRDHSSLGNCQEKNILHINKLIEAKCLGKRVNLEKKKCLKHHI